MTQILGPEKSLPHPLFHSISMFDTTLLFLGIWTKTVWAAYQVYADISATLVVLSDDPRIPTVDSVTMANLRLLLCTAITVGALG